jgi:PIN domain nuclease of toxin-antitoxin system
MNLLLDTHVFIWWRANDRRIDAATRELVLDAPQVFVSLASAWETAIKIRTGKLTLSESFQDGVRESAFTPLPIDFVHAEMVATLPLHHRDPFDRMLVAQAMTEDLTLVTVDRAFGAYGVKTHRL